MERARAWRDPNRATVLKHPASTVKRSPAGTACLVVVEGDLRGSKFHVDGPVTVGRAPDVEVVVPGKEVSRRHATIRPERDGFVVEDLGSCNGTFVNDVPVRRKRLVVGDKIRVGATLIVFSRRDPMEDALRQRQRLESLGRLSAGVVHDLNNMLGVVSAAVDYVRAVPPETRFDDPDVCDVVADVSDAVERAADLCRSLLAFTTPEGDGRQTVIDVGAVCEEFVRAFQRTLGGDIRIETSLAGGLTVRATTTEIHQVLMNLCLNARDAMPDGGTLALSARLVDAEDTGDGATDGRFVSIGVADTGFGMDEETRQRIFDPFFTTKGSGVGFGIGLAMVRWITDAHGGRIDVTSELGSGTRFEVLLPLAPDGAAPVAESVPAPVRAATSESPTVLLVDDEAVVRRALSRVLRQSGYEVVEVASGSDALARLEAADEPPSVIVADLDMPEMRGDELVRRAREAAPGIPAVVVTGHDPAVATMLEVPCVRKPCDRRQLLGAIEGARRAGAPANDSKTSE